MAIDSTHPQYRGEEWEKIERVVTGRGVDRYLVKLNPHDKSPENVIRNQQYRDRAIFYALTGQTVRGMVGSIFRKPPQFNATPIMQYALTNADGAGVGLFQQAQAVTESVLAKGRAGLAVSFPQTSEPVTRQQMTSGEVTATIHRFEPEQILNWKTTRTGSRVKLSLVVLREKEDKPAEDDPYKMETVEAIRELYLDTDGIHRERQWTQNEAGEWLSQDPVEPRDANGDPWTEIPFTFVGAQNNDHTVDEAPASPLVELNVGHYRNSADYEDSVWYAGQAQPWMSGITQDFLDMMKANNMYAGSRNVMGVPAGETFGYAQPDPNPAVRQAMLDKETQMVSLGARMMTQGSATKTATQAGAEHEAETSILALVAENVSEAYRRALAWAARFMGAEDPAFDLNRDFLAMAADAQMAQAMMTGWLQGSVPMRDYVEWMKRAGLFSEEKTLEDYSGELDNSGMPGGGFPA